MSKNIIFVLDFIINSDKFSTDSFFVSLFSWNGMGTKDCGWLKVVKDTSHASLKFSWMKDTKRRLSSKDPSDWDGLQRRLMTWQPRNAAFVGCSLPFEKHPSFLLFGGCVKNVSPISSNMYINHTVLKRQLAQWVKVKSFTNVSAAAQYTLQLKILEDIFAVRVL